MTAQVVRVPCSVCHQILVVRITHAGTSTKTAMQDHRHIHTTERTQP